MKTVMQEFEEWIDKNCHKEKDVIDEIWFVSIQHDRLAAKFEEMLKKEHDKTYAIKKPTPASYNALSYRDIHLKPKKTVKYKEGDHVVIKNDLIKGEYYNGLYFSPSMSEYCGTEQIIIGFDSSDYYIVPNLPWVFSDDMIAYSVYNSAQPIHSELSKLEIAAMAMQGILANSFQNGEVKGVLSMNTLDEIAGYAVAAANALINKCNQSGD